MKKHRKDVPTWLGSLIILGVLVMVGMGFTEVNDEETPEKQLPIKTTEPSIVDKQEPAINQSVKNDTRSHWPAGAVAEIEHGAVICAQFKSAYRAIAIEQNPYVNQAGDCFYLPKKTYVVSVQQLNAGISKIMFAGALLDAFTPSKYVIEKQ